MYNLSSSSPLPKNEKAKLLPVVVHECETSPYINGRRQIEMCENGMLNRIFGAEDEGSGRILEKIAEAATST